MARSRIIPVTFVFSLALLQSMAWPLVLRAEEDQSQLVVDVRTVRAVNPTEDQAGPRTIAASIDTRLGDLRPKLQKLPFRQFTFVSSDRVTVPLRKRETLNLASGQTLTLRPLYFEKEKVCLWLKWLDKNGTQILDTRMHITPGESLIAGTDTESSPNGGLILAIEVSKVK